MYNVPWKEGEPGFCLAFHLDIEDLLGVLRSVDGHVHFDSAQCQGVSATMLTSRMTGPTISNPQSMRHKFPGATGRSSLCRTAWNEEQPISKSGDIRNPTCLIVVATWDYDQKPKKKRKKD